MSYKALYRKWRPADFSQVYGQDQVTSILKYQIANGRHSHAYLFCGSRGTGKTSCAKILAKALNCLDPQNGEPCGKCDSCRAIDEGRALDVIEMDAASNNRVDDVREIIDNVSYTPAVLKYRVYIVDEVHMLTDSAFNALLKTLEEPPNYIVFVLATTELNRLPATIISRCQRFDFARPSADLLAERMKVIANAEGAEITDGGAYMIAKLANGGFRDAISLLEMCISKRLPITDELVADTLGICGKDVCYSLVRAVADKNIPEIFRIMTETDSSSKDVAVFWADIIEWYRNMIMVKTVADCEKYLSCTEREMQMLRDCADRFDMGRLLYHSRLLDNAMSSMKRSVSSKRNIAELTLVRMSDPALSDENDALLARIEELESKILRLSAGGVIVPQSITSDVPDVPPIDAVEAPVNDAPAVQEAPHTETPAKSDVADFEIPAWWDEVIEKISAKNSSAGAYLRGTQLRRKGDVFEIPVRGRTALMILSREPNMKELCEFMTALSGTVVSPAMIRIVVEQTAAKERPGDVLFK